MNKHIGYASYVLRHKWYVFLECRKLGITWQGLTHDLSKLLPREWYPYANHFYGPDTEHKDGTHTPKKGIHTGRDETGYYNAAETGDAAFDLAWLSHQNLNPHHWQWWVLAKDGGGVKILPISHKYRLEMIADWRGASRAQGSKSTVTQWYMANRDKMQLHPITRKWLGMLSLCGQLDG